MSAIPDKIEFRDCPPEKADEFVSAIERQGVAVKVSYAVANDKSHFDRYGFDCFGKRLGVVYDRKAKILSVTAPDETTDKLKKLYAQLQAAQPKAASGKSKSAPEPKKKAADKPAKKTSEKAVSDEKKRISEQNLKKQSKSEQKKNRVTAKQDGAKTEKLTEKPEHTESKKAVAVEPDSLGGNLSFKKFTEDRFGDVVAKLKKRKQFKVASPVVQDKGKQTETITIAVSDGNQKLKLRFMPKKQVLQVQGKQETLFSEVRLVVSEESDFKSAVTAHAESADKKASDFNRQLKKLMPTAVGYMSEQVKLDFTIGVIEILDSSAEHYDYSMLLLPPFRGLERLIFDIQRAQNIVVKMIGQAYEKENNEYVLKASYRRKINSVVYPEVLSALYREYFSTRNFYTHSDAIGGENRLISTRKQAVEVFKHLLEVVEYNCRKLDEIGFSIDKQPKEKK